MSPIYINDTFELENGEVRMSEVHIDLHNYCMMDAHSQTASVRIVNINWVQDTNISETGIRTLYSNISTTHQH